MLEPIASERLFYTPLLRFRVHDHEALDDALWPMARGCVVTAKACRSQTGRGWHSEGNLFDDRADPVQTLREAAVLSVMEATRSVTSKVDPERPGIEAFRLDRT